MTTEIDRQGVHDVSRSNPRDRVFVRGNETTVDSYRFIVDLNDPEPRVVRIEKRTNGVWNLDGLLFNASSVHLGYDTRLGAVGGFLETFNVSEIDQHLKALLPHIEFDELGTTTSAHMPILDKRKDFIIFAGPPDGEIIAPAIAQVFVPSATRLLHSTTHTTGTVGATAEIQLSYYKGTDNNGILKSRINLPASIMPAATEFTIVYDADIGFSAGESIFFEFVSANNISLETNSGNVITKQNGHDQAELDVLLNEFTLSRDLDFTFSRELQLTVHRRFP